MRRPATRRMPVFTGALCLLGFFIWMAIGRCSSPPTVVLQDNAPTAQPATPLPGTELGNTFEGFGAANWSMGRYPGNKFAIAFMPKASKPLAAMWIVWKTARGYGAGTFGIWSFELRADNPRGHLPGDTVLARLDGLTNPPEGYYKLAFPNVPLTAGQVYHLVMYNTDPNPRDNWSSPNTIMSFPDQPWRGNGVLSYDGRSWRDWGARDNRCAPLRGSRAAYLLEYADGTKDGEPYYFAYEHRIYGGVYQGEQFIWKKADVNIQSLGFPVFSDGEPNGDLTCVLETLDGAVLASATVATPNGMTELPAWYRCSFDAPVTLKKDVGYRLYLKAPTCTKDACYATFVVYATATVPGWNDQTWGGPSACAVTFDGAWRKTPVPADLSFSMMAE